MTNFETEYMRSYLNYRAAQDELVMIRANHEAAAADAVKKEIAEFLLNKVQSL
jgi:hypothetical protein